MKIRLGIITLVSCFLPLFIWFSALPAGAAGDPVKVDPALQRAVNREGSTGYIIHFKSKPNLLSAETMEWNDRGRFVRTVLQNTAASSQSNVKKYLDGKNARYKSFWVGNLIVVEASDPETLNGLSEFSEIDRIEERPNIILYEPVEKWVQSAQPMAVEPNLSHIRADQVWTNLGVTGNGIVVASIDTGVRYTHEALVNRYRGSLGGGSFDHNYNWWDAYGEYPTAPADDNGHGSHTMGTMVGSDGGSNQTGMAPGARWMACRGCNSTGCADTALLECAQWMVAPWDLNRAAPNPDLRPHVVNNSWGDCSQRYRDWFQEIINNWHAAGIYPVFSNGNSSNCIYNSPPGCNTVGNPARYGNVTGVGATGTTDGQYAPFSNWGPTDNADQVNPGGHPYLKPQVMAPGINIRSSFNSGDTGYAYGSGTSMSAPHVSGLVALMFSACAKLSRTYGLVETMLQNTAVPIPYATTCGGEGTGNVPNNATGWGEIDAFAAVQAALALCEGGTVTGKVGSTKGGNPIRNALVSVTERSATTDAAGAYTLPYVLPGARTVTASAEGYYDQSVQVTITRDVTSTVDFSLKPKQPASLTGKVTDGSGANWPLYTALTASSKTGKTATVTNPITGAYTMKLFKDTDYLVNASSPGYASTDITLTTIGKFSPKDIELTVGPDCTAPGYESSGGRCVLRSGGLVTGLVKDGNTKRLLGDIVVNSILGTTSTDSNGRYVIFSPPGSLPVVANPSAREGYGIVSQSVTARTGKIVTSNFNLPAAVIKGPKSLSVTLAEGSTKKTTLRLQNSGGFATPFTLLDPPLTPAATVSLPPSGYKALANTEANVERAPKTEGGPSGSPAEALYALTGYPAYAVDQGTNRLVTFSSDTPGEWTTIGAPFPSSAAFFGCDFLNNDFSTLYAIDYTYNTLYTIDTATGAATPVGPAKPNYNDIWTGLTASVDGRLYGSTIGFYSGLSNLYAIDPVTGKATLVGQITNAGAIIDIAMNDKGEMYGLDIGSDVLVKIDPVTAEGKVIGSVGFNASYAQGMSFEKTSGVLYLAAYNLDAVSSQAGQLRVADLTTGNTALVGAFPGGTETDCLAFATSTHAPWLSESPSTGTLAARKTVPVSVTFDATGMSPGTYNALIKVIGGTPYDTFSIPVTMKVTAKKKSGPEGGPAKK